MSRARSSYDNVAVVLHRHLDIVTQQYEECIEKLRKNLSGGVVQTTKVNCYEHEQGVNRILDMLARLEPLIAHEEISNTVRKKKKQSQKEKSLMLGVTSHSIAGASALTALVPPVGAWLGPILAGASALTGYISSLLASLANDPPRNDYHEASYFLLSGLEIYTQDADVEIEWKEFIRLLLGLRKCLDDLLASTERYLAVAELKIGTSRYPFEGKQLGAIVHNAKEGAKIASLLGKHTDIINESFRRHVLQESIRREPSRSDAREETHATILGYLKSNVLAFERIMPTVINDPEKKYLLEHYDPAGFRYRKSFPLDDLLDERWTLSLKTLSSDLKVIAQHHNNLKKALIHFGSRYMSEVENIPEL